MAHFFSLARLDGTPAEANEVGTVNGEPLPDGSARCYRTAVDLMRGDPVLGIFSAPDAAEQVPTWCVVEHEAGESSVIEDEANPRLFAIPLAEIRRTPLLAWIEKLEKDGTPEEADEASMLQTMAEVALD